MDNINKYAMNRDFAFGKNNFICIGVSLFFIILGLVLMSGGGSTDGVSFNPAIFSTQRIVVAPVITVFGFLLMIYAILMVKKSKPEKSTTDELD